MIGCPAPLSDSTCLVLRTNSAIVAPLGPPGPDPHGYPRTKHRRRPCRRRPAPHSTLSDPIAVDNALTLGIEGCVTENRATACHESPRLLRRGRALSPPRACRRLPFVFEER